MKKIFLFLLFVIPLFSDDNFFHFSFTSPHVFTFTKGQSFYLYNSDNNRTKSVIITSNTSATFSNSSHKYWFANFAPSCNYNNCDVEFQVSYRLSDGSYKYVGYFEFSNSSSFVIDCPGHQHYDMNSQMCFSPCPNGQVRNSSGECHSVCSLNPPSKWDNLPFYSSFNDEDTALDFIHSHHLTNAYLLSINDMPSSAFPPNGGSSSDCPPFYLYADLNNSSSGSCSSFVPPIMINDLPLQGTFSKLSSCANFLDFQGLNGICKSFNDCPTVYVYYKIDGNVSYPPPFDDNNSLSLPNLDSNATNDNSNFDDNFTLPNQIDDNNDSVDLNPLLGQIKQLSNNQHNDLGKLFDNTKQVNHNLNTLINLMGATTNKLSSIKDNTGLTASNTNDISDNTKKIADSLNGEFDNSKVDTALNSAKDIFKADDNQSNNSDNNSSDVIGFYSNYSSKGINALQSMFNHIDFGINDIFNVPDYDFVDIPFPQVDIDSINLHLSGKLLDADFLNSLDFGLVKLFFILLTLIWSARYIFDRLFP